MESEVVVRAARAVRGYPAVALPHLHLWLQRSGRRVGPRCPQYVTPTFACRSKGLSLVALITPT